MTPEVLRAIDAIDTAIDGFLRFGGHTDEVVAALEYRLSRLRSARALVNSLIEVANDTPD